MFDELVLDDAELLRQRDSYRLLWNLAGAGAQVRRAVELRDEFGVDRLAGDPPRAVLVATDAPPSSAQRVLARLTADNAAVVAWHGVELPRWAGPADALLIGAVDGRHPRLAELAGQAGQRGLALAVVAPADSPVTQAAGRAPVHPLPAELLPRASRWAVLAPLLQAADALGICSVPPLVFAQIADALDENAEVCRPSGDSFTNPAKSLALQLAHSRPVIAGAGPLASVAARVTADAVQLAAGVPAVEVSLPDDAGRAGALLRGPDEQAGSVDDFFRDRLDDPGPQRACLVMIGDDGDPAARPTDLQVQLDELAARRAAAALRQLAERLGAAIFGVEVPAGPPLVRYASASAFGEFSAAYLGFGFGLDPGAPRPAELGH